MITRVKLLIICLLISIVSVINLTAQVDTTALSRELLFTVYHNSIDSTLILLHQGAKINYRDGNGMTPIFYAIQNQNLDMVKMLEYNGANLNKRNFEGTTPLSSAVWFGYFDIAEFLCFKGASVNQSDAYGAIPLHYAAYLGDYYMVDMLLFNKSDVNNKSFDKNTPLHLAALSGDTAIINLLIHHGANPDAKNSNKLTPIEIAVEHKHLNATLLLLESDTITENADSLNSSLLNLALKVNADTIAKALIASPKRIPPKKNDIDNPYNIALSLNKYELKPLLKKHGYSSGLWPFFIKMSVMNTFIFNKDDHYLGFQFGVLDVKYNLDLSLGYGSRFSRKPVMISIDKNTFYQLNERRNYIDFGLKKRFFINSANRTVSFFVGVDFQAHFGNYSGTNIKLEQKFAAIPKAGIALIFQPFIIEVAYNYINYGLYDFSPHFASIGIGFNINFISHQTIYTPNWL